MTCHFCHRPALSDDGRCLTHVIKQAETVEEFAVFAEMAESEKWANDFFAKMDEEFFGTLQ